MNKKINVALVGLGFGGAFAAIYKAHPNVGELTLCDSNPDRLKQTCDYIGGARMANSLDEILADPSIDAVHLVTPIPLHADMSVAVLEAGKHCACTVPMATSLDDIRRIVRAKRMSCRPCGTALTPSGPWWCCPARESAGSTPSALAPWRRNW